MRMQRRGWVVVASVAAVLVGAVLLLGRGTNAPETKVAEMQLPAGVAADTLRVPGVPEAVGVFLENGQAWRAARLMREYLREAEDPSPEAYLLAARAEAGWGGWTHVRRYLSDASWLDAVNGGEGWYFLGRALEENESWQEAWEAYDRYLQASDEGSAGDRRAVARLRQGLVLLRLDRPDDAARLLESLRTETPDIADRIDLLAAEALVSRGDTAGVTRLATRVMEVPDLRARAERARLRAYEDAEDFAGAATLARQYRERSGDASDRAWFSHFAGRMALEAGAEDAAREDLRAALRHAPGSAGAGGAAALLEEMGELATTDRLALARTFDARGANGKAVGHYRAWLAAEVGSADERRAVRQALGQAQFDSGEYSAAVSTLQPLGTLEAKYLIARAEYRRGNESRGREAFLRLAREHVGSGLASQGLFTVADLAHDELEMTVAKPLYRQVADDFPGTDRAGLSLMRLAGAEFEDGDYASAAALWEEYRTSYPRGERWMQSTYWAGRAYEAAGNRSAADSMYREVITREPLSYYTLQASRRLGEEFWPPAMAASPGTDPAAEARVAEWMHSVDMLQGAGLHGEAEAQADRWIDTAGRDPTLLYPLAEALNERGLTVRGIRIGLRLQDSEPLNPRLLRIVYPFPYRPMLEAEAAEKGLDPFVVAALIRQESLFKARISSAVGARGLMQVMPETGRGLARGADIDNWDAELLFQPEINAHLGMVYLQDQMQRWDGSLPSVFSAYNAGPNRIAVWRNFPEYDDEELFTERIPYRETRDYVKILTRNIAIYRGLYAEEDVTEGSDPGGDSTTTTR